MRTQDIVLGAIGGLAVGALLGLATYLWTGVPIHVGGVAL